MPWRSLSKKRKQIRLLTCDYNTEGAYFVTLCSAQKKCIFGTVIPGDIYTEASVSLSPLGRLAADNLKQIPEVYPQILLMNSCIMPNHIHLLLHVQNNDTKCMDRTKMLISKAMQSFKASVTRKAAWHDHPIWQPRFYDHVVRDEADCFRIWQYIDSNPAKWAEDRYYLKEC